MPDSITVRLPERDDVAMAARMTNIQFGAFARRLERERVLVELADLVARRRIERGRLCDPDEVTRWLLNGWNTEQLLRSNKRVLTDDALRHSLQWAFPQAYYSVFAVTLASFRAIGYTEESHGAVIRKFGAEARANKYPSSLCALADGYPPVGLGVGKHKLPHSLAYDSDDIDLVDAQLGQFLCATRRNDLKEKKGDIRVTTKSGARRKAFPPQHWQLVSDALGLTSLLSLLYRKRIKANYRDIDTFLHDDLDAPQLYTNLVSIVSTINLVHEVIVWRALGKRYFDGAIARLPGKGKFGPPVRARTVEAIAG